MFDINIIKYVAKKINKHSSNQTEVIVLQKKLCRYSY